MSAIFLKPLNKRSPESDKQKAAAKKTAPKATKTAKIKSAAPKKNGKAKK